MKIAIITGSRADWNGLGMVGKALKSMGVAIQVLAIGQHADVKDSLSVIRNDGFDPKVCHTEWATNASSAAIAATAIAGIIGAEGFDAALIAGDRYEILGAAMAAALEKIPLIHIGGGCITQGSIDDKLRNAITALADCHFPITGEAYYRLMARLPPHSYLSMQGSPALDRIKQWQQEHEGETASDLFELCHVKHRILVALHSATNEDEPWKCAYATLDAIKRDDCGYLCLGTNTDTGSEEVQKAILNFCEQSDGRAIFKQTIPPNEFYSALSTFDLMVGNSSAAIIETASFGIPVLNIGTRQDGRPQPANVVNCRYTEISQKFDEMLKRPQVKCHNPYGNGQSAKPIAEEIVRWLTK